MYKKYIFIHKKLLCFYIICTWSLQRSSTFSAASLLMSWASFSWSPLSPDWCPFSTPCRKTFSYTCSITFLTCIISLAERRSLEAEEGIYLLQICCKLFQYYDCKLYYTINHIKPILQGNKIKESMIWLQ